MKDILRDLVILHQKLSERVNQELADQFVDQLTLCLFVDGCRWSSLGYSIREKLHQAGRVPEEFSSCLSSVFNDIYQASSIGDQSRYVFINPLSVELTIDEVDLIRENLNVDWSKVELFIFGRIFELTLESNHRSKLGAHYTPLEDIQDLIEPVVLRPLRELFIRVKDQSDSGIVSRGKVRELLNVIRSIKVLDPACGAGNFLLIVLWSLLDLEKEVITFARDMGLFETVPCVNVSQIYGIEKNERAFNLARVVLNVGYISWVRSNCPDLYSELNPFYMKLSDNFINGDAVLDLSNDSIPQERVWPDVDYIVGNPPYLGASKMRQLFGDSYCDILNWVFSDRVPGSADFGAYWFEKARDMIDRKSVKRAGFVISTTIKQEWSRPILDRINQSGKIFFAISDKVWEGGEAAVHVSLIGFTNKDYRGDLVLDGKVVPVIHSNLSTHHDISKMKQLKKRGCLCISGNGDVLENSMSEEEVINYLKSSSFDVNDYVRPFRGGRDLVQACTNRWTYWNSGEGLRNIPKLSGKRYLVTPRVSKHCVFLWLDSVIVPDSGVVVWDTDDDFIMGILQSRVHRVWTLANCGWRGETRNYQIRACFGSFSFPDVDEKLESSIREIAKNLDFLRINWLYPEHLVRREHVEFNASKDGPWQNYSIGDVGISGIRVSYPQVKPINSVASKMLAKKVMTNLYNEYPSWLRDIHEELDRSVFKAYGWDESISDEGIIYELRLLNESRSGGLDITF